jgi:hypothetical protein
LNNLTVDESILTINRIPCSLPRPTLNKIINGIFINYYLPTNHSYQVTTLVYSALAGHHRDN